MDFVKHTVFKFFILITLISCKVVGEQKSRIIVAFGDSLTRGSNPKNPANTGAKGYLPYLSSQFNEDQFLNCGIGGQTTRDAKPRYSEILLGNYTNCTQDNKESDSTANFYDYTKYQGKKPDVILLWLGTNDVLKNEPDQKESLLLLRWYVSEAKRNGIEVIISLLPPYGTTSFYPMVDVPKGEKFHRIRTFNNLIEQVAKENNLVLVDPYSPFENTFANYTWDQIHLKAEAYKIVSSLWEKALRSKEGKKLFMEQEKHCTTGTGYSIYHGVAGCSCASQSLGKLYRCQNGEFQELYDLNQHCQDVTYTNHNFITYHCEAYPKS